MSDVYVGKGVDLPAPRIAHDGYHFDTAYSSTELEQANEHGHEVYTTREIEEML